MNFPLQVSYAAVSRVCLAIFSYALARRRHSGYPLDSDSILSAVLLGLTSRNGLSASNSRLA